ncbi:hypothetical protein F4U02_08815 [Acinetobacter haemolyticus]|uniref:hypothetical protein n=1 Tax=Acinetobacter haemolyticus TaxID=29430 RepID=UPI0012985C8F|nr:hypothetical protein [Acinetobacter haemolyticus]MQZ31093.1 hypothetical protein [Acinetobacter haemolyticus]
MKTKFSQTFFAVLIILNLCFSLYLYKENRELSSDISSIHHKLNGLDFEALEKIKSKPQEYNAVKDCGSGMWQVPC